METQKLNKLGTSETLQKATIGFVISLSVRMEQLGPPVEGFSLNKVFEVFSKICRKYSSSFKI